MSPCTRATTAACLLGSIRLTTGFIGGAGWLAGMNVHAPDMTTARSSFARQSSRSSLATAVQSSHGAGSMRMVATEPSVKPVSVSVNPRLAEVFNQVSSTRKAAFIPYLTAGYPKKEDTVDLLLGLQEGGADVIELGVPFTDPQADGATIQATNQVALQNNVRLTDCLDYVKEARARGLTAPVILMGYLNPFLAYGLDELMVDVREAGV
ncbi:unnamed protein product, partial [Choristocarpus tenellus]